MNEAGFATVNPSTGEEIEAFSYFTPAQIEKLVAQADKSFQSFRKLSVHKRAQLRVHWSGTFVAKSVSDSEASKLVQGIFEDGSKALAARFARSRRVSLPSAATH